MFKLSSNGKGMIFGPNGILAHGKIIMAPMEHTPMVYSFNEKGIVLWEILFRSGNGHGKR